MSAVRDNGLRSSLPDIREYDTQHRARDEPPLFQYPAMMVSSMQGALLDAVLDARPKGATVFDPFMGSATTLAKAAERGIPYVGADINPLAVLMGQVETSEAAGLPLLDSTAEVTERARRWQRSVRAPDAPWCAKWFRSDVATGLAALRASIRELDNVRERRFFWLVLGEVVRSSGNHRIGAPKLQTRSAESLARDIDVREQFSKLATQSAAAIVAKRDRYEAAGWFERWNEPRATLKLCDVRHLNLGDQRADVVLTSPPYGDNHTTMPYGQASYLPLKWIDIADINSSVDPSLIRASKSLDTASLGGSLRLDEQTVASVLRKSTTLEGTLIELEDAPASARKRTTRFFADMAEAFSQVLRYGAPDVHLVITIGDKTTYGVRIPTADILIEILSAEGVGLIARLPRDIGRGKRLAPRNEFAVTIGKEEVLVLQRSTIRPH